MQNERERERERETFKNELEQTNVVFDVLFVCFDSLRPINNLSVKKGRVFLG